MSKIDDFINEFHPLEHYEFIKACLLIEKKFAVQPFSKYTNFKEIQLDPKENIAEFSKFKCFFFDFIYAEWKHYGKLRWKSDVFKYIEILIWIQEYYQLNTDIVLFFWSEYILPLEYQHLANYNFKAKKYIHSLYLHNLPPLLVAQQNEEYEDDEIDMKKLWGHSPVIYWDPNQYIDIYFELLMVLNHFWFHGIDQKDYYHEPLKLSLLRNDGNYPEHGKILHCDWNIVSVNNFQVRPEYQVAWGERINYLPIEFTIIENDVADITYTKVATLEFTTTHFMRMVENPKSLESIDHGKQYYFDKFKSRLFTRIQNAIEYKEKYEIFLIDPTICCQHLNFKKQTMDLLTRVYFGFDSCDYQNLENPNL